MQISFGLPLVHIRNMQIHLLITLAAGVVLHEATSTTLDLHSTSRLLLDVLHVAASVANHLGAKIEAGNGFEIDWYALLWPFPAAKCIAFGFGSVFAAAESAFVDEVGELLLHELIDLLHGFLEAILGGAGDVEIKWRVLRVVSISFRPQPRSVSLTAAVAKLLSG